MRTTCLHVPHMDCPTEEALIRKRLAGVAGVRDLRCDFLARQVAVDHDLADDAPILAALTEIGMAPRRVGDADPSTRKRGVEPHDWLLAGAGVAAVIAEGVAWATGEERSLWVAVPAVVAVALGGGETLRKAWTALRTRTLNIFFLMTLAVGGAVIVGAWPEAAMVMVLFAVAERIESASLDRARHAVRRLMELAPQQATVLEPAGWREVPVAQVSLGARVRIRPGERVPVDGRVLEGASTVDQAPVTGESIPVEKVPGDAVFAGTMNQRGSLEVEVTSAAGSSTLDRIIKAVREAQAVAAPTQRFVDAFAARYTPTVVAVALTVAILPPLLGLGAWSAWIYRALVLLVIACPCALVISVPVTVVSGLTAAARAGVLVKGGGFLEKGAGLTVMALDKTGTLTHGRPAVTDVVPLVALADGEALHLAASLNARSEHPVAGAIVAHCAGAHNGQPCVPFPVDEFEALLGRGVSGRIEGRRLFIGNHRLVEETGVCGPHVEDHLDRFEAEGKTAVVVGDEQQALAVVAVADRMRATAPEAVRELGALGVRTLMLTGDNPSVARAVGAAAGVADVRGGLLPNDKLDVVGELVARGEQVGMLGDGINDAPALARATIGFAMGAAGSDTALETADVALMEDDLRKLPWFIRLSRATLVVLRQNIALALAIKALFFALALAGYATLWMAVFADVGASLLVVGNGLRLLRFPAPAPAAATGCGCSGRA